MKRFIIQFMTITLCLFSVTQISYAQEPNSPEHVPVVPEYIKSLQAQVEQLRLEEGIDNQIAIQQKMEVINDYAGFVSNDLQNLEIIHPQTDEQSLIQGDFRLGFHEIFDGDIGSYATFTEQRAPNAGRIWVAYTYLTGAALTDYRIQFVYSDDKGSTWTPYAFYNPFTNYELPFSIDIEVVERNGNDEKFIYFVCSTRNTAIDKTRVLFGNLQLNTVAGASTILNWPSITNDDSVYNPAITSDNSRFANNPWIYISTSVNKLNPGGDYKMYSHLARKTTDVYAPNVSNVSYRDDFIWYWDDAPSTTFLYNDIAYVHSATEGNELLIANSNMGDFQNGVWISGVDISGTNPHSIPLYRVDNTFTDEFFGLSIAAPGGTDQDQVIVTARMNYQVSGDWDVYSWKTNDFGTTWDKAYVDSRVSTTEGSGNPSIVAKRGMLNEYYVAYTYGSTQLLGVHTELNYQKHSGNASNSWDARMTFEPGFGLSSLKAGFNMEASTDNCFVLFGKNNGLFSPITPLYSFNDCDPTVGIEDLSNQFESNVYPNPTSGQFTVEVNFNEVKDVQLNIINMLGQVVSNETIENTIQINKTIDLDEQPSGQYLLVIKDSKGNHLVKKSIQKY